MNAVLENAEDMSAASKTYPVVLSPDFMEKAECASGDAQYLLFCASRVLSYCGDGIALGYFDTEDPAYIAILHLAGRALKTASEQEGAVLSDLSTALRKAAAEAQNQ